MPERKKYAPVFFILSRYYTSLLQAKIPVTIFFSQYFLGSTAVLP
jgi:hypothetical protein